MNLLFVASRLHPNYTDALEQVADTNRVHILTTWTGENERMASLSKVQTAEGVWSRIKSRLLSYRGFSSESLSYRKRHPSAVGIYRVLKRYNIDSLLLRMDNRSLYRAARIAGRIAKCDIVKYRQTVLSASRNLQRRDSIYPVVARISDAPNTNFVPLCISLDRAKAAPQAKPLRPSTTHKLRIVATGKMVERKGHHVLLKALADLKELIPLSLTIYASYSRLHSEINHKYRDYLNSIVERNQLGSIVTFSPMVAPEGMLSAYSDADLFVHPGWVNLNGSGQDYSYRQMNGQCGTRLYSLLEAMVVGLPVVVCDDPLICGAVEHGANGLVFQRQNPKDLAQKILDISTMDLQSMGKVSHEIVCRHYDCRQFPTSLQRVIAANSTQKRS